jgi:hypothetical protein
MKKWGLGSGLEPGCAENAIVNSFLDMMAQSFEQQPKWKFQIGGI